MGTHVLVQKDKACFRERISSGVLIFDNSGREIWNEFEQRGPFIIEGPVIRDRLEYEGSSGSWTLGEQF